jgi:hypothetical protein
VIALGLAIFGATDEANSNTSDIQRGKTLMKSAIIMFFMIYLLVFALVIITMKDVGTASQGEKRIYLAVLGALSPLGCPPSVQHPRSIYKQPRLLDL